MARSLHPDVIVPPGLLVNRVEVGDRITIIAQPVAASRPAVLAAISPPPASKDATR